VSEDDTAPDAAFVIAFPAISMPVEETDTPPIVADFAVIAPVAAASVIEFPAVMFPEVETEFAATFPVTVAEDAWRPEVVRALAEFTVTPDDVIWVEPPKTVSAPTDDADTAPVVVRPEDVSFVAVPTVTPFVVIVVLPAFTVGAVTEPAVRAPVTVAADAVRPEVVRAFAEFTVTPDAFTVVVPALRVAADTVPEVERPASVSVVPPAVTVPNVPVSAVTEPAERLPATEAEAALRPDAVSAFALSTVRPLEFKVVVPPAVTWAAETEPAITLPDVVRPASVSVVPPAVTVDAEIEEKEPEFAVTPSAVSSPAISADAAVSLPAIAALDAVRPVVFRAFAALTVRPSEVIVEKPAVTVSAAI
jgi:hypothetical protein